MTDEKKTQVDHEAEAEKIKQARQQEGTEEKSSKKKDTSKKQTQKSEKVSSEQKNTDEGQPQEVSPESDSLGNALNDELVSDQDNTETSGNEDGKNILSEDSKDKLSGNNEPQEQKDRETVTTPEGDELPKIDPQKPLSIVGVLIGDPEEVFAETQRTRGHLNRQQMDEYIRNHDPHMLRHLLVRRFNQENRGEEEYEQEVLKQLKNINDDKPLNECLEPSKHDKRSAGVDYKGNLSGYTASKAMVASLRGLKKVYLYNSGFSVTLQPPKMNDLNSFFNTVDMEGEEFGRQIGAPFVYMMDVFLKRHLADIIPSLVIDSNLTNWENGTTLIDNISIHDYDVIVWALCTMMHKNLKNPIEMTCVTKECYYSQTDVDVDLEKVRFDRKDLLEKDDIEFVLSSDSRTADELRMYREKLNEKTQPVTYSEIGLQYNFQVPTLGDFIRIGETLINSVTSRLEKNSSSKDEERFQHYLMQINNMLRPWVKEVGKLNDDGGIQFTTSEGNAIMETLELDLHEDTSFFDDIAKFIARTRVSHLCYTSLKCPKCGAMPTEGTVDEFTTIDVQSLFFDLTCRRLKVQ